VSETGKNTLAPLDDPLTGPFWAAAASGRLAVQQCGDCGELRWPPLAGCPECRSRDTSWAEVAPRGTIWSFVTYHRAFQAELKSDIPYTVLMVQLEDGPYIVGRLIAGTTPPSVGDRVTAEFPEVNGVPQVRWRVSDQADGQQADGQQAASGGSDGQA
jgi:hypothetical protein